VSRVCMLVHHYFPRDVRVRREARALAAAGLEVSVIALRQRGEQARERWQGIEVLRLPVRRHRGSPLPVYLAEYSAFAAAAGLAVRALARAAPFDVIHVHTPPDFLVAAAGPARARGARLVVDIHDLTPELYGARFRGLGGRAALGLLARMEQRACRVADRVLTVTDAFRRLLVARGAEPGKVGVLHNCPDEEIFDPARLGPRAQGQGFRVVHHGTLVTRYGLGTLLDAFALVAARRADACLDIYGEGDLLPGLQRRSAEPPLLGRVRLLGDRPQEEVARAVAAADLCVVPNLADAFTDLLLPTKLLEALRLGRPAVASATTAIREAFPRGVRLVPPGDPAALAEAILALAADPAARAALAAEGRAAVERFSWRLEKLKLLDLYRELGARRPA